MQLAEILTESFHAHEGIVEWFYPVLRLGIYEDLKNRLRTTPDRYVCLVAEVVSSQGQDLVGTVEMAVRCHPPWQSTNDQYPYLSNLAVDPDFRRQGVAQQLLSNCEQVALEWGFSDLYLHVLENNHPARQLYLKAGYRLHRVEWHWTSWFFGQPRRLFLHKQLVRP